MRKASLPVGSECRTWNADLELCKREREKEGEKKVNFHVVKNKDGESCGWFQLGKWVE